MKALLLTCLLVLLGQEGDARCVARRPKVNTDCSRLGVGGCRYYSKECKWSGRRLLTGTDQTARLEAAEAHLSDRHSVMKKIDKSKGKNMSVGMSVFRKGKQQCDCKHST